MCPCAHGRAVPRILYENGSHSFIILSICGCFSFAFAYGGRRSSHMVDDDHHIVENDSRLLAVRKSVGKCRHPSSDTFGVGRADRYRKHVMSLRKSQGFTRGSFRQESAAVRDPENDEAPRPMQDKGLSGISFMHARRRADCVRHSSTAPLMPEVTSLA